MSQCANWRGWDHDRRELRRDERSGLGRGCRRERGRDGDAGDGDHRPERDGPRAGDVEAQRCSSLPGHGGTTAMANGQRRPALVRRGLSPRNLWVVSGAMTIDKVSTAQQAFLPEAAICGWWFPVVDR